MVDAELSIGAFGRRSRLSMKALRLYDRLGLLRPTRVDPDNGYRWYRESQLEQARLVSHLRGLEMPLAKIAEIVDAAEPDRTGLLTRYWDEVERRLAVHRELVGYLHGRLSGRPSAGLVVHRRDVAAQLVLTEQRHVGVDDLSCWIGTAMARLTKAATDHGGVAGHPFVVYHGDVSEDSDGPAEVCVPIGAETRAVAMRAEPAHREVFVRLRRAQVEFPQILSAYDAIASWITENGLIAAGPPREIYFGDEDFFTAPPSAEVCDVAFPVG